MPYNTIESISTPGHLFMEFQRKRLVSKGHTDLFISLLQAIQREDLIEKLQSSVHSYGADQHQSIPFYLQGVTDFLRTFYKSSLAEIQPLPWCHDFFLPLEGVYTNLQFTEKDRRGRTSPPFPLQVSQLMDTILSQGRTPRRVRVEGPPGIGKSTFCQKVVYEWACGNIPQFSLAFLLEMKDFSGKIIDTIFDQLLPEEYQCKFSKTELWDMLLQNSHDVLFVLDGLDEIDPKVLSDSDIIKLIQGKTMYGCTVIVTSRPHEYDAILKNCHPNLKVTGYTPNERNQFIKEYFSGNEISAGNLIKKIESKYVLSEICQTPLNTILLCVLWEDNSDTLPDTLTALYKDLTLAVSKNYSTKVLETEFEGNKIPDGIMKNLIALGKYAWDGIRDDRLIFQQKDITPQDLLSYGFLTKDVSKSRIRRSSTCHFLHKTFQEFFASLYISEMMKGGEDMTSVLDDVIGKERQIICVFLSGLLLHDAVPVLKSFYNLMSSPNLEKSKFERTLNCCLVCLKESAFGEDLAGIIVDIFPKELYFISSCAFSITDAAFEDSRLENLKLSLVLTDQVLSGVVNVLAHPNCKVTKLIFNSALTSKFVTAILKSLPKTSSIQSIDLASSKHPEETVPALSSMIERCENLAEIVYQHSASEYDDQISKFLTDIFKALNKCSPRDMFRFVINITTGLYHLPFMPFKELSGMGIKEFEIQLLSNAMMTVQQYFATELGNLLKVNQTMTKLSVCLIGFLPCCSIDLTPVQEGLEINCYLKCFNLWFLGVLGVLEGPTNSPSAFPIVKALSRNTTLQELSLTVSAKAEELLDVFRHNSHLNSLTIWFSNDLGEFVLNVLSALIGHQSINTLCLRYGGPMSSQVLQCLSDFVRQQATVSPKVVRWDTLVPNEIQIETEALSAFYKAVRDNEAIQEIVLPPIKCSDTDYPAILDLTEQIKTIVSDRSCKLNIRIIEPVKKVAPSTEEIRTLNIYGNDKSKGPVFIKEGEKLHVNEKLLEEMSETERQPLIDLIRRIKLTDQIPGHILKKYF
ncbi:NACHT, LRR and PYD domains-containing protein 3-like isoform X2 [Glandiceps talaboti]